jgi:BirA family biotin operon repressor/biotin-[acetyl-CoA-carboxylase] ligase
MSEFQVQQYVQKIDTQWLGRVLNYKEEIDSTNTWAKKDQSGQASHGALYITDRQTKGRGQYNRVWNTEGGVNLTFSVVLRPSRFENLTLLTLAFALGVVNTYPAYASSADDAPMATIKWPNDVRVQGKKWVGILTETVFSGNRLDRLVIGLGINVNQTTFPEELRSEATSLRLLLGQTIQRELLLCELCSQFEYQYRRWHQQDPALAKEVNQHLEGAGTWAPVEIDGQKSSIPVFVEGVTEKGHLRVHHQNGEQQNYSYEQIRIVTD